MTLRSAVRWPFAVTRQWFANIGAVLRKASPEDVIPPWLWEQFWGTVTWLGAQFPAAAGYKATPYDQMVGSVALAVFMIVVSIGVLTPLSAVMVIPFFIGAARLHPVVDRVWPLASTNGGNPV